MKCSKCGKNFNDLDMKLDYKRLSTNFKPLCVGCYSSKTQMIHPEPIKLKEILHRLRSENKEGLTELDNWKITDYDFMTDMGFKPDGMYHFALKSPHIKITHKKNRGFVVEDYSKTNIDNKESTDVYDQPQMEENEPHRQTFSTFKELSEYFTNYEQKWEHTPYQS